MSGAKIAIIIVLILVLVGLIGGLAYFYFSGSSSSTPSIPSTPYTPPPYVPPSQPNDPYVPPSQPSTPSQPSQPSQPSNPPPVSSPSLRWSSMNDWFGNNTGGFAKQVGGTLPSSADEAAVKKMCEDLSTCQVASREDPSKPWKFYSDFRAPRWMKGAKSFVNEREKINFGRSEPLLIAPNIYKEVPGINPFGGNGKARQYLKKDVDIQKAKQICDAWKQSGYTCTAVTQEPNGDITLWESLTKGTPDPNRKVWVNMFNSAFKTGAW
tara:strand:- start:12536 stop:13336 length:801 start_codon:yes stop_codon:yes gene_type:complete